MFVAFLNIGFILSHLVKYHHQDCLKMLPNAGNTSIEQVIRIIVGISSGLLAICMLT